MLRHAKPLAVARPEARLAGLVAALVVTFSGSLQPALAGNFLQDAVEKKAAEIQANIQKTDFQERLAKTQEDASNAQSALQDASSAAQDGSTLDVLKANVGANIDSYGKGGLDLSGFDSEKVQQEAQSRITKFQVAGDREKERALKVIAADTAQKQKRAAEVAAQAAAGLAETRDSVSASIASDTALKAFSEDAAGASERASAALAKAQATDLDAIQAQTKAALSEQFAAASGGAAEAVSKTVAGVSKQVETAKAGTGDYARKSASALSTVSLPSVDTPDIGRKVEAFQAAGKAELAKAQEASAKDAEKMGKAFEAAKVKAGADAAQAAADNADAAAAVSAQAAAALQQASSSASFDVLGAVEAKKVEVGKNIEKTDFQSRYAKAKKDAAAAKAAAEAAAAAAQSSLKEAQAAAQ